MDETKVLAAGVSAANDAFSLFFNWTRRILYIFIAIIIIIIMIANACITHMAVRFHMNECNSGIQVLPVYAQYSRCRFIVRIKIGKITWQNDFNRQIGDTIYQTMIVKWMGNGGPWPMFARSARRKSRLSRACSVRWLFLHLLFSFSFAHKQWPEQRSTAKSALIQIFEHIADIRMIPIRPNHTNIPNCSQSFCISWCIYNIYIYYKVTKWCNWINFKNRFAGFSGHSS